MQFLSNSEIINQLAARPTGLRGFLLDIPIHELRYAVDELERQADLGYQNSRRQNSYKHNVLDFTLSVVIKTCKDEGLINYFRYKQALQQCRLQNHSQYGMKLVRNFPDKYYVGQRSTHFNHALEIEQSYGIVRIDSTVNQDQESDNQNINQASGDDQDEQSSFINDQHTESYTQSKNIQNIDQSKLKNISPRNQRGRPRKDQKRGRGRPSKNNLNQNISKAIIKKEKMKRKESSKIKDQEQEENQDSLNLQRYIIESKSQIQSKQIQKKGRGRPRKPLNLKQDQNQNISQEIIIKQDKSEKKGRGRPKKSSIQSQAEKVSDNSELKKYLVSSQQIQDQPAKRFRGRPKKVVLNMDSLLEQNLQGKINKSEILKVQPISENVESLNNESQKESAKAVSQIISQVQKNFNKSESLKRVRGRPKKISNQKKDEYHQQFEKDGNENDSKNNSGLTNSSVKGNKFLVDSDEQ